MGRRSVLVTYTPTRHLPRAQKSDLPTLGSGGNAAAGLLWALPNDQASGLGGVVSFGTAWRKTSINNMQRALMERDQQHPH